ESITWCRSGPTLPSQKWLTWKVSESSLTILLFSDKRLIHFLMVGATNTVVSYLVFLLRYHLWFHQSALLAQPFSYGAGIVWSYIWNRQWTFQSSAAVGQELIRFVIVQIILLFLSTNLIYWLVDCGNINASIGWVLVTAPITMLNFFLTKTWVFSSYG
ncbi:MAG TPA: GtrA family protein, partial [Candidatus Competibacteraceae bacterium]|nr:GtrA family protein [Candidatus Competibacteraceae bacterium]